MASFTRLTNSASSCEAAPVNKYNLPPCFIFSHSKYNNPMVVVIILALVFDFLNGFRDSSNIVATMISSRAVSPRKALALAAISELAGPFLFGVAVAKTVGDEVVHSITLPVIVASLMTAIIWNLVTWLLGIPSSSSHALIGGILGSAIVEAGLGVVKWAGVAKVLIALFVSPILGLFAGWLFMKIILYLARAAAPSINWFFKRGQIITSIALALSHGTNDAQKTMGIITLALVTSKAISTFIVPLWVIAISATAISLGTLLGSWRLIRTLGGKFYKIRPVHGFTSQLASASVIFIAAILGGPVSTTQVVSTAIMGAGSAERVNKVRWGVAGEIVIAWLLTIPASAGLGALFTLLLTRGG
jgi:inorganic phosphate transporter, PiT family